MRLKIKKFIYLINDATNLLLKKERQDLEGENRRLRFALWILGGFLAVMIVINIYLILWK